ncbi:Uncharacterized protein APZ42_023110 [Daphnia magna]|uniref:Uncharacterized protein n=1 Tax=Daphnia magna TaxID=35525 RepID=A0A164V6V5_9CRUS|nr:Uncharacterized protein APZ42_023110 [Daphnia magna]
MCVFACFCIKKSMRNERRDLVFVCFLEFFGRDCCGVYYLVAQCTYLCVLREFCCCLAIRRQQPTK